MLTINTKRENSNYERANRIEDRSHILGMLPVIKEFLQLQESDLEDLKLELLRLELYRLTSIKD